MLHQKLNETHEYANIPPVVSHFFFFTMPGLMRSTSSFIQLADVTQNVYEEPDERANSQNELEKYKYDDVNLRPQSDDRYVQIPARASLRELRRDDFSLVVQYNGFSQRNKPQIVPRTGRKGQDQTLGVCSRVN